MFFSILSKNKKIRKGMIKTGFWKVRSFPVSSSKHCHFTVVPAWKSLGQECAGLCEPCHSLVLEYIVYLFCGGFRML